jgi:hypothetical protein
MHTASTSGQAAMALQAGGSAPGSRPDWRLAYEHATACQREHLPDLVRVMQVALAYRPDRPRLTGFAYHPVQAAGAGLAQIDATPDAWS